MTDILKILVSTGDSSKQIDTLVKSYETLDNATAGYAKKAPAALKQVEEALRRTNGVSDQFLSVQADALASLQGGSAKALMLTKGLNTALQGVYEAKLLTSGTLASEELALWKKHGVAMDGIQKAQLADFTAWQKAQTESVRTEFKIQAALRKASEGGEAARYDTQLKAMAAKQSEADTRYAALRKDSLARGKILILKAAQDSLSATQTAEKAMQSAEAARYDTQLKAMAAKQSEADTRYAALRKDSLARGKILILKAAQDSLSATQTAEKAMQSSQFKAAKLGIPTSSVVGSFSSYDATKVQAAALKQVEQETAKLANSNKTLSASYKQLLIDGNDIHSLNRGLASSFGLLWLTWGNLLPLFAGAAISSSVKNVITLGSEVQHTMETIRVLSDESSTSVQGLNSQLIALAKTGPYGPLEIANAMKTLSLAGLSAAEVSKSIGDVLNFAVAGTTDTQTAAKTLSSVATAFSISADGYNYVGDVISKTAAVSKTSVESIAESFKTASVIHKQYGASLEDVGIGLALLSNLGIEGTAGGTALRNMYADLSGRTVTVAKAMKTLGLELRTQTDSAGNATGKFADLVTMTKRYIEATKDLSGIGKADALKTIMSERGGKVWVEALDLAAKQAEARVAVFGGTVMSQLDEIAAKVNDSAGFMINSAAQLAMTPKSQIASMTATLQATLVEAFNGMEPEILAFSQQMKNIFNSEDFKTGIKTMATGALSFASALTTVATAVGNNIAVITSLAVAYAAGKTALAGYNLYLTYMTNQKRADTLATVSNTAAQTANNATKLAGVAGLLRFLPGLGTAVTAVGLAWSAYEMYVSNSKKAEEGYAGSAASKSIIEKLDAEIARLDELNKAKSLGMSLDELKQRTEIQDQKSKSSSDLSALQARIDKAKQAENAARAALASAPEYSHIYSNTKSAASVRLQAASKDTEDAMKAYSKQLDLQMQIDDRMEMVKQRSRTSAELDKLKAAGTPKTPGTKPFVIPKDLTAKSDPSAALDSIIKREREQAAALSVVSSESSEYNKVVQELVKNLTGLEETYNKTLKDSKDMTPAEKDRLKTSRDLSEELIRQNAVTQVHNELAKQKTELLKVYQDAQSESTTAMAEVEAYSKFEQGLKGKTSAVQAAEKAAYEIRAKYAKETAKLDEAAKKITPLTPEAVGVKAEYEATKKQIDTQAVKEAGASTAKVYKDEWDKTTSSIAEGLVSKLMKGTMDIESFLIETFSSMVLQPQLNMVAKQGVTALLGGGPESSSGNLLASFLGLPSFAGGGFTGTGSRSGGIDGKGGYAALLHPNETVIDHTVGGGVQSSSAPVYVTVNNTVGDVATKSMIDAANAATVKQIQAGMARSARYNGAMSRT